MMPDVSHGYLSADEREEFGKDRPKPGKKTRAAIRAARKRQKARPARVTIKADLNGSTLALGAPHSDPVGWQDHFADTYGTGSQDFATVAHVQLERALCQGDRTHASAPMMNFGLAAVAGVGPTDELEAMLAVQMVGTHTLAMEMLMRARASKDQGSMLNYVNSATKLQRTFAAQMEALGKKRSGGKQQVEVRYVYVDARTQSIINQGAPGGGPSQIGGQPHAPALGVASVHSLPMWSPDPVGGALSVPGDQGEATMPDARGQESRRSPRG